MVQRQWGSAGTGQGARIDAVLFVADLTYHLIDGAWLITSKAYHVEIKHQASA